MSFPSVTYGGRHLTYKYNYFPPNGFPPDGFLPDGYFVVVFNKNNK